jgi:hypothetical protein
VFNDNQNFGQTKFNRILKISPALQPLIEVQLEINDCASARGTTPLTLEMQHMLEKYLFGGTNNTPDNKRGKEACNNVPLVLRTRRSNIDVFNSPGKDSTGSNSALEFGAGNSDNPSFSSTSAFLHTLEKQPNFARFQNTPFRWVLHIDVEISQPGGGVLDALCLTIREALRDLVLPKVEIEGKIDNDGAEGATGPRLVRIDIMTAPKGRRGRDW